MASAELWALGILVTIHVAVLSTIGAILKVSYDIATDLKVALYGNDGQQDDGFIPRTQKVHEQLTREQREMHMHMRVHGRLLNEMAYAFCDIAQSIEESDVMDDSINTDRVERWRDREDELWAYGEQDED